jgi:hypothetical protein
MLPKIQTKVPEPLVQDLPAFLTTRGVGTPTIGVLFLIFVRRGQSQMSLDADRDQARQRR